MAAVQRHVFNDLPASLQNFLHAGESFTDIQRIFAILLSRLKDDLSRTEENPFTASRAFVVLEFLKSEFAAFEKQVASIHHAQASKVLPKLFEDNEIPEMPLNEGFKVEVTPKFFCSIKAMNKCSAHQWLRENNLGDIIQPEVNAKTLNSALQEFISSTGEEPPQDIITTYIAPMAKCKKSKVAKKLCERDEPINVFGELFAAE